MFSKVSRTVAAGALAAGLFSVIMTPAAAHAATHASLMRPPVR